MLTPQQADETQSSTAKTLVGISLIVPWIIIDMVLKKRDPSLAYAAGLFIGIISGYLLSPKPPRFWVMLLIAILLAISHFVFAPYF